MNLLQIGCNNGQDHVGSFCEKYSPLISRAILVDASLEALDKSQRRYQNFPNFEFLNVAVVDTDISVVSLFFPENRASCGHASLSEQHVTYHNTVEAELKKSNSIPPTTSIPVPAARVNNILSKFHTPLIDRLYIDVEGYDARILSDIDFDTYLIPYIRFEFIHSDGPFAQGPLLNKALDKLKGYNYTLIRDGEYDLVAIQP